MNYKIMFFITITFSCGIAYAEDSLTELSPVVAAANALKASLQKEVDDMRVKTQQKIKNMDVKIKKDSAAIQDERTEALIQNNQSMKQGEREIKRVRNDIKTFRKAMANYSSRTHARSYRRDVIANFMKKYRNIIPVWVTKDDKKRKETYIQFKSQMVDMIDYYYSKARPVLIKNVVLRRSDGAAETNFLYIKNSGSDYSNSYDHDYQNFYNLQTRWHFKKEAQPITTRLRSLYAAVIPSLGKEPQITLMGSLTVFPKLEQAGFVQQALIIESEIEIFKELHKEYLTEEKGKSTLKKMSHMKSLVNAKDFSYEDLQQ